MLFQNHFVFATGVTVETRNFDPAGTTTVNSLSELLGQFTIFEATKGKSSFKNGKLDTKWRCWMLHVYTSDVSVAVFET